MLSIDHCSCKIINMTKPGNVLFATIMVPLPGFHTARILHGRLPIIGHDLFCFFFNRPWIRDPCTIPGWVMWALRGIFKKAGPKGHQSCWLESLSRVRSYQYHCPWWKIQVLLAVLVLLLFVVSSRRRCLTIIGMRRIILFQKPAAMLARSGEWKSNSYCTVARIALVFVMFVLGTTAG